MIPSFSRKGCPYDNACIESFHATLKKKKSIENNMKALRLRELRYLSTLKAGTIVIESTEVSVI